MSAHKPFRLNSQDNTLWYIPRKLYCLSFRGVQWV